MSSQNSHGKKSLARISDFILGEQIEDIKAYTSGHLNENHLWKPNRQERRKQWDSKSIQVRRRPNSEDRIRVKSVLTQFQQPLDSFSHESSSQSARSYKELPPSEKDISLKILSSHLAKGMTKAEKLKNMISFQNEVIKKGTRLEKPLNKYNSLSARASKNSDPFAIDLLEFQSQADLFDSLIEESKLFGEVLRKIKHEYETYISFLINQEYQEELNTTNLVDVDSARSDILTYRAKISQLENEIDQLNNSIKHFIRQNIGIEKSIISEEMFAQEKRPKLPLSLKSQLFDQTPVEESSKDSQSARKQTLKEKIDNKRTSILKKLDEINAMKNKLRKDHVPSVVISNLNQTIKDLEIENHKIMEQNKFLQNEEIDAEKRLKSFLISKDKTEFAEENVEEILNMVKSFEMLKLNKGKETSADPFTQTSGEFYHYYDDYFS